MDVLNVDIVGKQIFCKSVGSRGGVVSTDGDEQFDVVVCEELEIEWCSRSSSVGLKRLIMR